MRADALLSKYGYCTRREAAAWLRQGRVVQDGVAVSSAGQKVDARKTLVDGKPVDCVNGVYVALNKPVGYTCSHAEDEGGTPVYELLPEQWMRRNPQVQSVGRLDKDTSGLLLLTDDGEFLHALTSPRRHVAKVYSFETDKPVPSETAELFASGEMLLKGEKIPCLPAQLEMNGSCTGRLTLQEGRYHQVRRMLAAVGAPVVTLCREEIGALKLAELQLKPGEWVEIEPSLFRK